MPDSGPFSAAIQNFWRLITHGYMTLVPAIVGTIERTGLTAAEPNLLTVTVGDQDSLFQIDLNGYCTAYTSGVCDIQVQYTDENNTPTTLGVGSFSGPIAPQNTQAIFRAKAGTTITVLTVNSFTMTYNIHAVLVLLLQTP